MGIRTEDGTSRDQQSLTSVAVVCGGQSPEHEVSIRSARSILHAIDRAKYRPTVIVIDMAGRWGVVDEARLGSTDTEMIRFASHGADVHGVTVTPRAAAVFQILSGREMRPLEVDIAFPVVHGATGEDGTLQGFCRMVGIPCVGSGVFASAACIDKEMTKRLLVDAGIDVAEFVVARPTDTDEEIAASVTERIGFPCFVKPASLGSSIGVSKVARPEDLVPAVRVALQLDDKVLIERAIVGREIECSVLGNDRPEASVAGEIVTQAEFYSYDTKYLGSGTTSLQIPAQLSARTMSEVRDTAIRAYRALGCAGMARVDFFIEGDGRLLVNEINTLPGFTSISMYPKMWEASGLAYPDLIDRLIVLALEKFAADEAHIGRS